MKDEQPDEERQRALVWALSLKADPSPVPEKYEQELLERYSRGQLTLAQITEQLNSRVQHVLYHSQAVRPMRQADLTELLEQSQRANEIYNVTGLLCYSDGHFVQLIEGSVADIQALFANILRDPRHQQVQVLSERAMSTRWFADWRMALVEPEPHEVHWLLSYLQAKEHNLERPQMPLLPSLLKRLVEEFSKL